MKITSNRFNIKSLFAVLFCSITSKEDLLPHLLECDIIVYDITGSPDQVDEATWAVSGIFLYL